MGAERWTTSSTISSSSRLANQEVKTSTPTSVLIRARTRFQSSRCAWLESDGVMTGLSPLLIVLIIGGLAWGHVSLSAVACRVIHSAPFCVRLVRKARPVFFCPMAGLCAHAAMASPLHPFQADALVRSASQTSGVSLLYCHEPGRSGLRSKIYRRPRSDRQLEQLPTQPSPFKSRRLAPNFYQKQRPEYDPISFPGRS